MTVPKPRYREGGYYATDLVARHKRTDPQLVAPPDPWSDPSLYPPEPCPRCGGRLKWVQYGLSWDPEVPNIEDLGCLVGPENRYCPTCERAFRIK